MIYTFLKKINLLNWQNIEDFDKDKEDVFLHAFLKFFFFKTRIMKSNNLHFFNNLKNNTFTFHIFLTFRYNFFSNVTFLLGHFEKNKFQWTNFNYIPYKLFTRLKINFSIESLILNQVNDRFEKLKNLIIFKKKTGFLKKKDKLKNFLLLRLNNLKNFKFLQNSLNKGKIYKNSKLKSFNKISHLKIKADHSDVNKFLELKKRWYKNFSKNRGLLKVYSNIKKKKQFQLTKIFYKNIKREVKLNLLKNEFALANLIVRSKFVFTNTEAIFFVKNGFVFVNGFCIVNPKHMIGVGDVVNIVFLKNYFFFFKTNFSQKLRLTYALGYRLWRLNRFKNNFYKQSPTGIPEWIFKLSFFYEDSPSFIEIDYLTLTFALIKIPSKFYEYNYFFTKFLNLYLMRLYNWKYIN